MKNLSISNQRGISLLTVLLLLLIMTVLGLASLRSTLMEEKMSGNSLDRGVAFQAAESALREAEGIILLNTPASACVGYLGRVGDGSGLYPCNTSTNPRWLDVATVWGNGTDPGGLSPGAPQILIEEMGPAPTWRDCDKVIPKDPACLTNHFRITVRSHNPNINDRSMVILQSNYAVASPN